MGAPLPVPRDDNRLLLSTRLETTLYENQPRHGGRLELVRQLPMVYIFGKDT
jgi:hypothetical protein